MIPNRLFTAIIALTISCNIALHAQDAAALQAWTSKDGRVIQAKFVKLDGEAVVVQKGGKEVTIPFAKLSAESVAQAKKAGDLASPSHGESKPDSTITPGSAAPGQKNLTLDLGDGVTMEFVLISPGTFTMGAEPAWLPNRKVTITKPFCLGKYEVTQEQWDKVMGSNKSRTKGPKNPVEVVSWGDCMDFIGKLKDKLPGQILRLPTEAEWEYAHRAGSTGKVCLLDNGKDGLLETAWLSGNANLTTHPVGEKKPNAWGLYDMHGNVWEWCSDRYEEYSEDAVTDPQGPQGPERGQPRVFRGGSWYANGCRSNGLPSDTYGHVGFRLACQVKPN